MRTLYIDCFSGASGDMFLGALVDLGVDVAAISAAVDALGLEGVRIETRRVERSGLTAVKANVLVGNRMETVGGQVVDAHDHGTGHDHGHAHDAGHSGHEHHHAPSVPSAAGHAHEHGRSAAEILQLIQSSQLPERIRLRAASVSWSRAVSAVAGGGVALRASCNANLFCSSLTVCLNCNNSARSCSIAAASSPANAACHSQASSSSLGSTDMITVQHHNSLVQSIDGTIGKAPHMFSAKFMCRIRYFIAVAMFFSTALFEMPISAATSPWLRPSMR